MGEGFATRPTIFLDTNALHYVNSYLRNAEKYGLPPFSEGLTEVSQVRSALTPYLPSGIVTDLMKGCRTLAYLQARESEDDGVALFTSRLSKAELLFGVLEGQAHARMALEGMPYRMRQRMRDLSELVSMRLGRDDYEKLRLEVDQLFETLDRKAAIRIMFAEDIGSLSLIAGFSELLQSSVFLDVLDCWMYGCAVAVQADQIVTFDSQFRRAANVICNPQGDPEWLAVQSEFYRELGDQFPVQTAISISLPMVQDIPDGFPQYWGNHDA